MEEKFTLIHTFTDSSKIHIYRIILEGYNVPYFIKDELSNQVFTESSFIGGAKLLVDTAYIGWVITLFESEELALDYTEVKEPSFMERLIFEKIVSRLPTDEFGTPKTLFQVLKYSVILFVMVICFFAYIHTDRPSELEELLYTLSSEGCLCVKEVNYLKEPIEFFSNDDFISLGCREKIHFADDKSLILPGVNSRRVHGYWEIDQDNHLIIVTENLENIYSGKFRISKSKNTIRFTSESSSILLEYSRNFSLNSF